jgi:predicted lipoprotein
MNGMKNTILLGLLFALFMGSCKEDSVDGNASSDYNRANLLKNYSSQIIVPNYTDLDWRLSVLKDAVVEFNTDPTMATLTRLKQGLKSAQLSFQGCTSFEFGPASISALRSVLSTYPTSEAIIEQNIMNGGYDLFSIGNIAAKGFPAIDYLLYGSNKSDQEILDLFLTDGSYLERREYLLAVTEQSQQVVAQVKREWTEEGYQQVFENSDGKGVGSSVSLMMNALVLDFERFIRDGKVGIPLGVRSLGVANPEKVEAFYSESSLEIVKESIDKYTKVFNGISNEGVNGEGLDDYLIHEGAASVAEKINNQLASIVTKLNLLQGPLSNDVLNNKPAVQEVYDEMQKAIVILKVEMPSALSVLITYQDSDGD